MTATPELIIWIVTNLAGMLVCAWLTLIAWERRISTLLSTNMPIGKKDRLKIVNKEITDRFVRFLFFLLAAISGILLLFNIQIPFLTTAYILVAMTILLSVLSILDLIGELKEK